MWWQQKSKSSWWNKDSASSVRDRATWLGIARGRRRILLLQRRTSKTFMPCYSIDSQRKEGVIISSKHQLDQGEGWGFLKWRTVSASASPTLSITQCLVAQVDYNSMNLPMKISSEKGIEIIEERFVDSGAGRKFINQYYIWTKGFKKERLLEPIMFITWMELLTNKEPSGIM